MNGILTLGFAVIASWLGFALVFYVLSMGVLIEFGGEYYSFSHASGRRRLLLHALLAMPLLLLLVRLLPDWFI
jgi:hypothetical protein